MSTLHFWPDDLVRDLPPSPLDVLKEAAKELGRATQGAVEAEVRAEPGASDETRAFYSFQLVPRPLTFHYGLLYAAFDPSSPYPCTLIFEDRQLVAHDETELRANLVEVVRSPSAVSRVKTLLAQSLAA